MYSLLEKNPDFIVIAKNPGASFHREEDAPGLFETLREAESPEGLYPVHRLDKVTSGLLVMARTEAANHALCEQFAARQTEKYYLAISDRKPSKKQGMIRGDMEKSRRGSWRLCNTTRNPAVTRFFSYGMGEGLRLFVLRPLTGKTHQLRVAMKSLGAPILGDSLYGDAGRAATADRCYLHAWQLGFHFAGRQWHFVSPPTIGSCFNVPACQQILQQVAEPHRLPWP